jgi:hypothetical protein
MTKIKSIAISLLATCLFFVACLFATAASAQVTNIKFSPQTLSPQPGTDIQVDLVMEVVGMATYSDITINIPPEITVKSVTNGGFFDNLLYPATSGQPTVTNGLLELHGYFSDPLAAKTGIGTLAHLTFTSSKILGSTTITFQCDGSGNDTGITAVNGQNILTCSSLNQLVLTYANATAPPNNNASTNACGGTCGSNYNCNSGLYCYQGYCRNPDCANSSDCVCRSPNPTVKPTAKPTAKPTFNPANKPTPPVITLAKTTPFPSLPPYFGATPPVAASSGGTKSAAFWIGAVALVIILIVVAANLIFKKKSPPKITPPTQSGGGVTTFTPPPVFPS